VRKAMVQLGGTAGDSGRGRHASPAPTHCADPRRHKLGVELALRRSPAMPVACRRQEQQFRSAADSQARRRRKRKRRLLPDAAGVIRRAR
jgi:hypothetical protein